MMSFDSVEFPREVENLTTPTSTSAVGFSNFDFFNSTSVCGLDFESTMAAIFGTPVPVSSSGTGTGGVEPGKVQQMPSMTDLVRMAAESSTNVNSTQEDDRTESDSKRVRIDASEFINTLPNPSSTTTNAAMSSSSNTANAVTHPLDLLLTNDPTMEFVNDAEVVDDFLSTSSSSSAPSPSAFNYGTGAVSEKRKSKSSSSTSSNEGGMKKPKRKRKTVSERQVERERRLSSLIQRGVELRQTIRDTYRELERLKPFMMQLVNQKSSRF